MVGLILKSLLIFAVMGIVFRQSVKNTLVTLLGAILGTLIIWLSTKYIIDKQQFGYTKTLAIQAVTLSQFLLFGLNNTLVVFIHRYANQATKRKLLITFCCLIPILTTSILTLFYMVFKNQILHHFQPSDIPLMQEFYIWLPVYTLLFIYMIVLEQYLGSQMKVAISAFMREVVVRVLNIALLLLFVFNYVSFHALVVGTVLIYIIPILILLFISTKTELFGFSVQWGGLSKPEYKEMIHFSWYHFLLTVALILLASMDALLIPFYDHSGFKAVAPYSIAVFLISFLD